jgi:hypothetical protein
MGSALAGKHENTAKKRDTPKVQKSRHSAKLRPEEWIQISYLLMPAVTLTLWSRYGLIGIWISILPDGLVGMTEQVTYQIIPQSSKNAQYRAVRSQKLAIRRKGLLETL